MRKQTEIHVLDRAMWILDLLSQHELASLTRLSSASGLPLSTTSRIVKSLLSHGLIEQDVASRAYRLGARLLFLGSQVGEPRLLEVSRPILERLSIESQEDAGLSILQGTHAAILDRVEGPHPLKIVEAMRQPVPLNCGAFRKALLAYQAPSWIEQYMATTKFVKFTKRTITTAKALRRELQWIRDHGYAVSYGEYLPDSGGIGAPVFGLRDELQAAVFIWGPYSRLNETTAQKLAKLVVQAAADVTKLSCGGLPVGRRDHPAPRRR